VSIWFHFGEQANRSRLRSEGAAQLVEFAVALPLLVLFVVGIFDFSSAFTLKQRLTNIARDAARAAAVDPVTDLAQTGIPASVVVAFQTVDKYLTGSRMNDCNVQSSGPPSGLTWTFTSPGGMNGCPAPGLTIIINRGYAFPPTGAVAPDVNCRSQGLGGQMALIGTCVSIQYPYPWKFGRAARTFGRSIALPAQISAVAVALNEN
jgi:TadE-like protein